MGPHLATLIFCLMVKLQAELKLCHRVDAVCCLWQQSGPEDLQCGGIRLLGRTKQTRNRSDHAVEVVLNRLLFLDPLPCAFLGTLI